MCPIFSQILFNNPAGGNFAKRMLEAWVALCAHTQATLNQATAAPSSDVEMILDIGRTWWCSANVGIRLCSDTYIMDISIINTYIMDTCMG